MGHPTAPKLLLFRTGTWLGHAAAFLWSFFPQEPRCVGDMGEGDGLPGLRSSKGFPGTSLLSPHMLCQLQTPASETFKMFFVSLECVVPSKQ